MAQRTAGRLLEAARPYGGRVLPGLVGTVLSPVLDGVTVVVLVPLLKALFGSAGALASHGTALERVSDLALGPLIAGLAPRPPAARLVLVLLAGLLLKKALQYAANQLSVAVQEGVVRDLRVRLYRHLLALDLGFFQRN